MSTFKDLCSKRMITVSTKIKRITSNTIKILNMHLLNSHSHVLIFTHSIVLTDVYQCCMLVFNWGELWVVVTLLWVLNLNWF